MLDTIDKEDAKRARRYMKLVDDVETMKDDLRKKSVKGRKEARPRLEALMKQRIEICAGVEEAVRDNNKEAAAELWRQYYALPERGRLKGETHRPLGKPPFTDEQALVRAENELAELKAILDFDVFTPGVLSEIRHSDVGGRPALGRNGQIMRHIRRLQKKKKALIDNRKPMTTSGRGRTPKPLDAHLADIDAKIAELESELE